MYDSVDKISETTYQDPNDSNKTLYRDIGDELGGRNATIDVNMTNLVGAATAGRGNAGKSIRNKNSTFITEKKGSSSYNRHKANAGK